MSQDYIQAFPMKQNFKPFAEVLEKRKDEKISANDLVKMAAFFLKNNYFQFCGEIKYQISRIAIGTKLSPT